MTAPAEVLELIERFGRNRDAYLSGQYKETQVRVEFIDPLFIALGWDVHNTKGYAEAYKDVVHEETLRMSRGTQAPDYCFRIGGTRKFFLEAKKPSIDIRDDVHPAYQLRRYAWSAKLPLSVLTDFEELAVYDCRVKPAKTDKASAARILYLSYDEYDQRWDEIAGVFHREEVLKGSFDRYVESVGGKRGTAEVDDAFLAEIESWRDELARNIALRNPSLTQRELNFAVQRTIDRIIFLRICEDRGIESYGRLLGLINSGSIYERLLLLFRQADARYNAGLFYFHAEKGRPDLPDELTPNLVIDDRVLKSILANLYYPDSPYEFSVLPADILGQVYEQFLGKVIRLTPKHRAVVEEKPEVKKAGGVYYTPTYIVDYIVEHTVGKLLEGKTLQGAARIRILDPACGSGSFLLGAYQYLLGWYRDQYAQDPERWARSQPPRVYQGSNGDWDLTTAERKRILLQHIYGVDIDAQAVEVTKLSLLLKVLEGESEQTLGTQLQLFQERALPDLADNVKCGNSLIGPDFYAGRQLAMFDEEERYRINVFDWNTSFPEVMEGGGFDAVIGNPPYGIIFDDQIKGYLEQNYETFVRNNDNYVAFLQRSIELLAPKGLLGFIVPNTFLLGPYFNDLKRYILDNVTSLDLVDFGINQVFQQPNVFTALVFLQRGAKGPSSIPASFAKVEDMRAFPNGLSHESLDQEILSSLNWSPASSLARLFQSETYLDDVAWVKDVGLNYWTKGRGKVRGGSIADRVLYKGKRQHPDDKPYLKGRDIARYLVTFGGHWLRHDYPDRLNPTVDTFRFSPEYLEREKIIYRQTADRIIAAYDSDMMLTDKTLHTVVLKEDWARSMHIYYLLGLLNSSLMTYLYRTMAQEEGRDFAQVKVFRMKKLPIPAVDSSNSISLARHDRMVSLVETMLSLNEQLAAARVAHDKRVLQRQIDATDKQIDQLVYELYDLTEGEIEIVEEASR
ncbi:MAG: N-6 DNA methylase [Chloroflexia bacterium]|nr:N-6 DNA methylase [Chloroflexia bacterium]